MSWLLIRGKSWYSLGPLVAHGLALLDHAQQQQHAQRDDARPSLEDEALGRRADPGSLLEEVEVSGLGLFRAFSRGRVRVRFDDRTILQLDQDERVCHLLLPDATAMDLPLDRGAAGGPDAALYAKYVAPAVQFLSWAFMPPDEREQAAARADEAARRIRHEVHR